MKPESAQPPKIASWMLSCMAVSGEEYSLLGDFEEEYHEMVREVGTSKARSWFWMQAFRSVPSFVNVQKLHENRIKKH
jgi:hypothetical protein